MYTSTIDEDYQKQTEETTTKTIEEGDKDFGVEDFESVVKVRSQKIEKSEVKKVSKEISDKFTAQEINKIKEANKSSKD